MREIFLVLLLLAAGTWLSALAGAAAVGFVKKDSRMATDIILGFAAGVILMVCFIELLHPAIHMSERYSAMPAWFVVPGAFALGFLATFFLDSRIGRLRAKQKKAGKTGVYKQGLMLFGALSMHNIPEGLALGVLFGVIGRHFYMQELLALLPLVIAIALHKFPEGAAIAVAFQKEGMSKLKSFLVGQVSGFFGFMAGIIGFAAALNINAVLPYAMAFAGGAMVWVAVHELIPESKRNKDKKPYLATIGIFLGVLMMLVVDTSLHVHHHGHDCRHEHHHHCILDAYPQLWDICKQKSKEDKPMITIAICDDLPAEIDYLTGLVRQWAAERKIAIQLRPFPSAEAFLFAYEEDSSYDILLLDIQMTGLDGVTLARQVRTGNKEAQIIFVTGYMDYIADGYDVEALNYLIKPVAFEKLSAVLDRAAERLARNEKALFIQYTGENVRIPLYEIRYLEVMHNHVTIYAGSTGGLIEYKIKKPLSVIEAELDSSFFRTGRSFIVNLRYVRKSTKTEVHLEGGVIVPLSRGLYTALNRAIIENT